MGYSERVWRGCGGGCGEGVGEGVGEGLWEGVGEGVGEGVWEVNTYPNQSVFLLASCIPVGTYNTLYTLYTASL